MGSVEENTGELVPRSYPERKDGEPPEGAASALPTQSRWASWDEERDGFGVLLLMQHGGPRHAF